MESVETTCDSAKTLTTVKAKGSIKAQDILNWITEYYSGEVTALVLWDFTEADLSQITTEQFRAVARAIKKRGDLRRGGKTALVFSKDMEFGLGRMFEALSEIENMDIAYKSFRDADHAKRWLGL